MFCHHVIRICNTYSAGVIQRRMNLSEQILRRYGDNKIYPLKIRLNSTSSTEPKSKEQQLVYHGSLASRVRAVKVFSLTTSLAGIAAQPILFEQGTKIGTGMTIFLCAFAGFFTFMTPWLLHFITKKYVTHIYYNAEKDEYTANTVSFLLQKQETKFHSDDVKVPEVPGMFTSFIVHQKPLFVDPRQFEDTNHYVRIMGYDKPIDFKLAVTEIPVETHPQKPTNIK